MIEFNNLSEHLGDLMFNALIGTRNLEEYFSNENGNQIGFVMKNPGTYGFDIKKRMYIWGKDAY